MRGQVFILEPTHIDVSQAERFGAVKYVFDHGARRVSIWDDNFGDEVVRQLAANNFNPASDFFVIVGHMVPLVLSIAAMLNEWQRINVLAYSSVERQYVERRLDVTRRTGAVPEM